jgi:DNA-binding NarL/FixJ family response regulator
LNCIIVDDEPLARTGIQLLVDETPQLSYCGSYEILIGDSYRKPFFDDFVAKNMLKANK